MSTIKVDTYLTRGGASEIAIDKLKGVTAAGSMLVVAEGGTNTTNLQQGLAKAWIFFEPDNSNLIRDSLNISAVRDNAAGQQGITLATAMGNDDWTCAVTGTGGGTSNGYGQLDSGSWGGSGDMPYRTTTQVNSRTLNSSGSYIDHNDLNFLCHGDLA